jgi:prepilin signal peptidase PulO-like enzyme (type II secretory pathway)
MRKGPISLNTHAAVEPFMAILLIAAPWIFGFSDVSDAKTICIVVGIVMLLAGAMTQWRLSLVKLIPIEMHFATDLLLGAFLVVSPFIFGFSDEGGATRFMIIYGAIELATALSTRWDPAEAGVTRRGRGDSSRVSPAR